MLLLIKKKKALFISDQISFIKLNQVLSSMVQDYIYIYKKNNI